VFTAYHREGPPGSVITKILVLGLALVAGSSCRAPHKVTQRTESNLDPGWPKGNNFFTQVSYQQVKGQAPVIPGAEYVNDNEICMTCHENYVKAFAHNVHRGQKCEACHGPASRHLETQGREAGLIFSFKQGDPVVRAEACLKCHEQNACSPGSQWRSSRHAHCGVTCVSCHRSHYNVPAGTPATSAPQAGAPAPYPPIASMSFQPPTRIRKMLLVLSPPPLQEAHENQNGENQQPDSAGACYFQQSARRRHASG
jgi:hypothetical protein